MAIKRMSFVSIKGSPTSKTGLNGKRLVVQIGQWAFQGKAQPGGAEHQPAGLIVPVKGAVTILIVPQQGMAQKSHMSANLVGAAGVQANPQAAAGTRL